MSVALGATAEFDVLSSANLHAQVGFSTPESTLRPWGLVAYYPQDFVMLNGFPQLPQISLKAPVLISTTGEYLSGKRPQAWDVDLHSAARFIATDSFWDGVTTYKWTPYFAQTLNYSFNGTALNHPLMDTFTYRVGKELITTEALVFRGNTMTSAFNSNLDYALGYTVGMVFDAQVPLEYQVLSGDHSLAVTLNTGKLTFSWYTGTQYISIPDRVSAGNYAFLIVRVKPPVATVFFGWNHAKMYSTTITAPTVDNSQLAFTIGDANSNFALAEWILWGHDLTDSEVLVALGQLTGIYGEV